MIGYWVRPLACSKPSPNAPLLYYVPTQMRSKSACASRCTSTVGGDIFTDHVFAAARSHLVGDVLSRNEHEIAASFDLHVAGDIKIMTAVKRA